MLPGQMFSPFALPLGLPSGLEQFSQYGVASHVPPHGFRPRELAEVGQVALLQYNHHVAGHVSDRLDMEGLGSPQPLRALLVGKDKAASRGLVQAMVDHKQGLWIGPTPLLATEVLLNVFEYAMENSEVMEEHKQTMLEL